MLTLPTKFANWYYRDGIRWFPILYVTDGTTEWWFSTKDMRFSLGDEGVGNPVNPKLEIHPLLLDIAPIRESIDFFTRRSSLCSLSVTISNLPYRVNASGTQIRFSDEVTIDFMTTSGIVKLYYLCGEDAVVTNEESIDNCLLVFQGRISEFPAYTPDKLTLNAYAELQYKLESKEIPNHTYNDIAAGSGTYRPPIIYGDYSSTVNIWHHPKPLVKLQKGTFSSADRYYIADHLITGTPNVFWYLPDFDAYLLIDSAHITVTTDSNRQYISLTTSSGYVDGYLFLVPDDRAVKEFSGASNESDFNPVANLYVEGYPQENAYDRVDSTVARAWSGITPNGYSMSSFQWKDYGEGINDTEFANRYNIDSDNVYLYWKCDLNGVCTYTYGAAPYGSCVVTEDKNSGYRVVDYASDIYDGTLNYMTLGSEGGSFDFDTDVGWKMFTNEFVARLLTDISTAPEPAAWRLAIHDVVLKLHIRYTLPEGADYHPDYLYVETAGQKVNSDIATRSGLTVNTTLTPAVYQIEMILRDHFDVADANIDETSFDYAYDISGGGLGHDYTGQFVFTDENRVNAVDFLQELCEHGQVALYLSPAGKAKIVLQNRLGYAPASYLTIGRFDLVRDVYIESTPLDKMINSLTYKYNFSIFNDDYSTATRSHADSIAQWGTVRLDDVEYHYSTAPDPALNENVLEALNLATILPIPRLIVNFETAGIKYIHLEIGDYITFASGLAPSGGFVIFEKSINRNTIGFRALEVIAYTWDPS